MNYFDFRSRESACNANFLHGRSKAALFISSNTQIRAKSTHMQQTLRKHRHIFEYPVLHISKIEISKYVVALQHLLSV
jgi:hypothetical protein